MLPRIIANSLTFLQSAFPKSDANLFEWAGTLEGAPGTVRIFQLQ